MLWIGLFSTLILGALLGSLAQVLVFWMYDHSSWGERVHCPTCVRPLPIRHRVPILSWFIWQGHCLHCGRRIRFSFPWMEIAMLLACAMTYLQLTPFLTDQAVPQFVIRVLFLFALVVAAAFDLRWKLLPVEFLVLVTVGLLLLNGGFGLVSWTALVSGMAFGAVFLGLQYLASHGTWMGGGDPLLGAMIGAALGWPLVGVSFYFTYVFGGLALLLAWILGRVNMKTRIPFGPLLAGGACLALWFGQPIVAWLRIFLS